ncbi:Tetraspanin-2A [Cryptotermes secundus]|uniref:Tetraspanin n=1 Tax=Cryptotermes secundus TaxID=105785 RepID=A0A2J7Q690_9NEOP|nr:Tetraspanin-2A [Cryptotermes secundus]
MSLESGVGEWMEKLELSEYYTGIYVLIAAGVILIIVSFLGCVSAFMEDRTILVIVEDLPRAKPPSKGPSKKKPGKWGSLDRIGLLRHKRIFYSIQSSVLALSRMVKSFKLRVGFGKYLIRFFSGLPTILFECCVWLSLISFVGVQVICFILGAAGAAVLLDYSTYDSQIQPLIRQRMRYLISESQNEYASSVLRMVQETIGCCGADGPNDYLQLLKPLPTECRDTVTGNAFFYGCVDELTWFLEDKSGWLSALALTACFVHVSTNCLVIKPAEVPRWQMGMTHCACIQSLLHRKKQTPWLESPRKL